MEVHIGWASETGNALDLAREFLAQCQQQRIQVSTAQQLGKENALRPGIWIFFVSTTGQGHPPHSMRAFWKLLMSKNYQLTQPLLFATYSLGDTSYGDHFGMAARKLRQRLKMLGGQEFAEIGLGDDMDPQGYRHAYLKTWRETVFNYLRQHALISQKAPASLPYLSLRSPAEEVEFEIESIEELSSHKGRRTYWARLRVLKGEVKDGDVVELFPHNRPEDVAWMARHWQKSPLDPVEWQGNAMTFEELLKEHVNVSSTLNYFFFSGPNNTMLAASASSPMLQDKVSEFSSNYEEYFNYIRKYRRNIIDFLQDFEIKLDYQYFLTHINEVVGRKYSVARVEGDRFYLLIKLVEDQITEGRLHRGLCSHDLFRSEGQKRKGKILQGDFLPVEMRHFNVLVTLGTGIAPFLWILDQQNKRDWKCLLIYTNSYSDEIHHHRLLQKETPLRQVISCTREGGPKMLRLLEREAGNILDFINEGKGLERVRVLYCGPKEVHQYLVTLMSQLLGISTPELVKRKVILHENW